MAVFLLRVMAPRYPLINNSYVSNLRSIRCLVEFLGTFSPVDGKNERIGTGREKRA